MGKENWFKLPNGKYRHKGNFEKNKKHDITKEEYEKIKNDNHPLPLREG